MLDRLLSDLRARWRALAHRDRVEDDLEEELAFHLAQEQQKLVARGVSPAEARRLAHVAFGGVERVKEDARDARGVRPLLDAWSDLRDVVRGLRAHRAFALGVAGTLALGIGANAAMFGIVDRLLFRDPSGLRAPDRVHRVHVEWTENGERRRERSVQYPRFLDLARQAHAVEAVGGFQVRTSALGTGDDTHQALVAVASASYLGFFDAPPVLGRWFDAAEDQPPGGVPVVVLGHAYWMSRYGGRADALGQTLQVDRMSATIVGVAPPGFAGVSDRGTPAVFVPMSAFAHALRGPDYVHSYNWSWLELVVRRGPGVTAAQATADLSDALAASWRAEGAVHNRPMDLAVGKPVVTLGPVHLGRGPDARLDARVTLWISGVALIVLLIACANVTNLLLSRTVSRQRELAMRLALGVGRARLVRQLVLEGLTLGVLGGLGGVVLARVAGGPLRAVVLPDASEVAVMTDPRTLAYAFALAVVAGALTAIVPAWMSGRLDVAAALKSGGRGSTHRRSRLQGALVVVQASLSVVLLVGAALFVRSLQHAEAHRLGYDAARIVHAEVNLRGVRIDDGDLRALTQRLLMAAQQTPRVTHAATAASAPFWSNEGRPLFVAGHDDVRELGRFTLQAGSADYFAATGTRVLRGRPFDAGDRNGAQPVIVVSDAMARALWPGREALGQCVRMDTATAPCRTVIGVAEDAAMDGFNEPRRYTYYVPVDQYPDGLSPQFFVRVDGPAAAAVPAIRARLQALLPGAAYVTARPLTALVDPQFQAWRYGATMFVAFGVLALLVALLGLHSVVAYESARREQEFGVRMALGATRARLLAAVIGRGAGLACLGIALGLALALAASGWFEGLLFEQSARDPIVLGGVAVVLVALAALASAAPAVRATRLDPSDTLRAE